MYIQLSLNRLNAIKTSFFKMILLFIIATITQSSECPHYDNVYEVKDGQDSRVEDKRVY